MPKKKVEITMDGATATVEVPEPLKRKCSIDEVLPASVIQLVKSAPQNDTIHKVLLAHLKKPVPDELITFNDIKDWVEFNIDRPKSPYEEYEQQVAQRNASRIQVAVIAEETESGQCNYSENLRGEGNMPLTEQEITEAARDAADPDDFWSDINQCIYDNDPRGHISMNQVENGISYSDHESNDTEGVEVTIKPEGKRAIQDALRRLAPAEHRRLFLE